MKIDIYRLTVFAIRIAPLRERRMTIFPLRRRLVEDGPQLSWCSSTAYDRYQSLMDFGSREAAFSDSVWSQGRIATRLTGAKHTCGRLQGWARQSP